MTEKGVRITKIYPIFLSEHDLKINVFKGIDFMSYQSFYRDWIWFFIVIL